MNYHQRHYGEKTLRLKPIEQHNTTLFHSRRYHVTRDYMGHYTLNDLKERKAVYLQGDDATQFEKEFNERIDKDALCEDYDPVMSGPCKVV